MGVDTKGYVVKPRSYEEIVHVVTELFPDAKVVNFSEPGVRKYTPKGSTEEKEYFDSGFMQIVFSYKPEENAEIENRTLSVIASSFDNAHGIQELKESYSYLSLGKWGSSVDIMTLILKKMGGFLIPDDCAASGEGYSTFIEGEDKIFSDIEDDFLSSIGYSDMTIPEKLKFLSIINKNQSAIETYFSKKGER